jgi:hypothetical protein
MIKAQLKDIGASKELFPQKAGVERYRSDVFWPTLESMSQQLSTPAGLNSSLHSMNQSYMPQVW